LGTIRTYAKGQTKRECYNDIARLVKRGYKRVSKVKPVEQYKNEYTYRANSRGSKYKQTGISGGVVYKALMELEGVKK
jgi:hypothetical protein